MSPSSPASPSTGPTGRTRSIYLALVALGCALVGVVLAFLGAVPGLVGFGLFALGAVLAVAAAIWAAIVLVRRRGRSALWALLASVPLAVAGVLVIGAGVMYPRINDIVTDVDAPPAYLVDDVAYPPTFGPIVRERYPDLAPLVLDVPADEAYRRARAEAERRWSIVAEDANTGIIQAVASTRTFRFQDDIVIRVSPRDGQSVVDVRSRSRVGKGDFGANANRIRDYLAALRAQ